MAKKKSVPKKSCHKKCSKKGCKKICDESQELKNDKPTVRGKMGYLLGMIKKFFG